MTTKPTPLADIAAELTATARANGANWQADDEHMTISNGTLTLDFYGFRAGDNWGKPKVKISLPSAHLRSFSESEPEIGVSPERTAAAIARDIARRLLTPGNLAFAAEVRDRKERSEAHEQATEARMAAARELPGYHMDDTRETSAVGYIGGVMGSGPRWELYCGSDHAKLTLDRITPELARELVRLLAERTA